MATIKTFRVGHCSHPSCMVLKGSGLASRCLPSHAYLIETARGNYLWDTGYAEHFRSATAKGIYRLYAWSTPVYFDKRESLAAQLNACGIGQNDIHAVLLSHFHADHVAGLRDLPGTRVLCSLEGWHTVRRLSGFNAVRRGFVPELLPDDIESRLAFVESHAERALPAELSPFTHGWDITGTGEIIVVSLPGHAAGHIGAFVAGEHGWTLLAGDAAWVVENYQQLRGPSELSFLIQHDRAAYYHTLHKLHLLHQSGAASIRIAHEATESDLGGEVS